ncbi:MAG TPA: 2OG-Fe(II) oxygenase [Terriglobales bacterium]|nr:2OG-Fe(II) oxygenase [Terriglobales bacterium]
MAVRRAEPNLLRASSGAPPEQTIAERVHGLDWGDLENSLSNYGYAHTGRLLSEDECESLVRLYPEDQLFRSRVEMARFRFGEGDYKYFATPLPEIVQQLRAAFYPHVAAVANRWMEQLGDRQRFPDELEEFLAVCHRKGQRKPTPLLLHYDAGDYNCLHQDLYGEVAFPLQLTCFLSQPGEDYTGGEFLLVEQRPRAQSKGEVVEPRQGDVIIFTTRYRPVQGSKGYYRVNVRHGVARVRSGTRYTLGIIFHDAK